MLRRDERPHNALGDAERFNLLRRPAVVVRRNTSCASVVLTLLHERERLVPQRSGSAFRREHLVTACLVGTVVVVVGFASGLGLRHPTSGTVAAPQPAGTGNPGAAGALPGASAAGGSPGGGGIGFGGSAPVNYVGTPPLPGTPTVSATSSPGTPTTSTAPPGTSTNPPVTPSCQPGLLGAVLDQVTTVVNSLPAVGSLLNGLTGGVPVSTPTPSPTASGGLVDGLTGSLLGSCPAPTTTPTPVPTGPGS